MLDKIKRDTEVNWNKAVNFIPKKNEIIIYDYEDYPRVKIGDGINNVNDLDFCESVLKVNEKECSVKNGILIVEDKIDG